MDHDIEAGVTVSASIETLEYRGEQSRSESGGFGEEILVAGLLCQSVQRHHRCRHRRATLRNQGDGIGGGHVHDYRLRLFDGYVVYHDHILCSSRRFSSTYFESIIHRIFPKDYSLRQVISTGKIANVNSYETLLEASFGRMGFIFVSVSMFLLSIGSMIAYLLIIKDVLPVLFNVGPDDIYMKWVILGVSSMLIIVPLSMQRDMADLEKTSRLNVFLDICIVALVVRFSPVCSKVEEMGGILQFISSESTFDIHTFFVGFGVCSFAFVCQDASFIIAGSMVKPSKQRWKKVTNRAIATCCTLELIIGISGYLAYQENTKGNVLNNMNPTHWAGLASRAMLSTTMFFAYPMNLYVARHAVVALLFEGVSAHEGDDAVVLSRTDRRVVLTWALYIATLVPAAFMSSTGKVLSVTGAVAGR